MASQRYLIWIGSSPLARGTLRQSAVCRIRGRFIPACAGNSGSSFPGYCSAAVHPRLRGELRGWNESKRFPCGSSPLARGTRQAIDKAASWRRFIPACAGNSGIGVDTRVDDAVHPRLRGELSYETPCCLSFAGSSPLARGTQFFVPAGIKRNRFIPACAGNSGAWPRLPIRITVHPRLRGELYPAVEKAIIIFGSSPLARGTRLRITKDQFRGRFIPACAGNSSRIRRITVHELVHPRLRGELIRSGWRHIVVGGSSPLARGTHLKTVQNRQFIL